MSRKRLALIVAIASTVVTVLAVLFKRSIPNGGERIPGYDLLRALEIPSIIVIVLAGVTAVASYIAVGVLGFERKIPHTVEFNKLYKFILLRRFALFIAAIPGFVLAPMAIAAIISAFDSHANGPIGLMLMISIASLMPGAAGMIALLVLAIINAFKEPIDKDTPRPKPHLLQIFLAAITALLPAVAYLSMLSTAFNCDPNCGSTLDFTTTTLLVAYAAMWVVLAVVWFRSKRGKATS
jgi:hypothetical protein